MAKQGQDRQLATMAEELVNAFSGNAGELETWQEEVKRAKELGMTKMVIAGEAEIAKLKATQDNDLRQAIVNALHEQVAPATRAHDVDLFATSVHNGQFDLAGLADWLESPACAASIRASLLDTQARRAMQALSAGLIERGGMVMIALAGEKKTRTPRAAGSTGGNGGGGRAKPGTLALVDASKNTNRDDAIPAATLALHIGKTFTSANEACRVLGRPARKEDGGPNVSGQVMLARYGLALTPQEQEQAAS